MIKLLIDGVEYDEVDGLKKAKINIVRDNKIRGLLIKFMSDVTFYGSAYDAIIDYSELNGDCSQIPISVYYGAEDGSGYTYNGYVSYKDPDTKIDVSKKHLTCKIQQGDLSSFILDKLNYVYTINTAKCIDGVTNLTQITEQSIIYQSDIDGGVTADPYKTFLIKDVLQQALEYLSNGAVSLNTTVFDTLFTTEKYETDFNTWASGETMTIEWTNHYGQTFQASQLFDTSENVSADLLLSRMVKEYTIGTFEFRDNYYQAFSYADTARTDPSATSDLDLFTHFPFTDVSISVSPARGGADPTITKTVSQAWGLKNLAITRRFILQNNEAYFNITLGQILKHITQAFNLTFSFDTSNSGIEMVLDFQENYFNNIEAIDLGSIPQIDASFSDDFAINQINTPNGKTDNVFISTTWNTEVCIGNELSPVLDGFSMQDFFNAIGEDDKDDMLLWVVLNDALTATRQFRYDLSAGGFPALKYIYNAPYFSPFIVERYFINSNKDYTQTIKLPTLTLHSCIANCNIGTLTNPNAILIDTEYTFSGRITEQQVKYLLSNSTQFIKFSIRDIEYNGFINDVSIEPYTNNGTLKLLSENIKQ